MIFAVAGLSGNGVIRAAKECQKFVVGVDSDQDHMAKGYVLTSVMKRLDNAVYKEVSGTLRDGFESGSIRYGLSNNGMELSPMKYTKDLISSVTLKKLQDVENCIRKGDLKVADFTGFEQDEDEKTGKQR
ncbi:MAG: BMP family ABC transporter substrate-binding protein [Desulfobulbaceae bacterium]|nr:BMP family ABC transporter substrate-binding protein [Desulfobulbaceae bacterium]